MIKSVRILINAVKLFFDVFVIYILLYDLFRVLDFISRLIHSKICRGNHLLNVCPVRQRDDRCAQKESSIITIHACGTYRTHRIDLCNTSFRCSIIVCHREYISSTAVPRRRSVSVIAKRRAMTHSARINCESDASCAWFPTRKENTSRGGMGSEKNIFSASLQAVWPSALSASVTARRMVYKLTWTRNFDIAAPDERETRCYRITW